MSISESALFSFKFHLHCMIHLLVYLTFRRDLFRRINSSKFRIIPLCLYRSLQVR